MSSLSEDTLRRKELVVRSFAGMVFRRGLTEYDSVFDDYQRIVFEKEYEKRALEIERLFVYSKTALLEMKEINSWHKREIDALLAYLWIAENSTEETVYYEK